MTRKRRPTDRRVIRTKREIQDALTQLLEQKSIDEISVKELTDQAGINRGTFYLHYVDKYDLLEKSVNHIIVEMRDLVRLILANVYESEDSSPLQKEAMASMANLFHYAQENHRFLKCLLSENSSYSFHHKFNEILRDHFMEHFDETKLLIPPVYVVAATSFAFEGLIFAWLEDGMQETPEEMGAIAYDILYRNMSGVVRVAQ